MFLIVVLLIVGSVSFVVVRTIQRGNGQRHLAGNEHGASLAPGRTAMGALMTTFLTVAVFVPLMVIVYGTIALVRIALGQ
jgi:ABC-type Fe3+ transport system permease subunit